MSADDPLRAPSDKTSEVPSDKLHSASIDKASNTTYNRLHEETSDRPSDLSSKISSNNRICDKAQDLSAVG